MLGFQLPTETWSAFRHRIRDEYHAGWLPAKVLLALEAIADLNAAGEWTPTVRAIAIKAGCSERTVRRARAIGEARGLLAVRARYEIVDGRAQQRANEYGLTVPTGPVVPKPRLVRGGQSDRPNQGRKKEREGRLLDKWLIDGQRAGASALAARRAAFLAQQAAQMAGRRQM